ncbi:MAG: glycine cleavage system protein H [Deltaproteobacteria bacterium]|nr:MAG: glycine cleavage system protein H [Deltaproteobacteria bacterium]
MKIPENLKYHSEHTWASVDAGVATVGITDFAQDELGDIIFVELPEIGQNVKVSDIFGSVESSKSVSDLYSPVSGEVIEVNNALDDEPETINDDPYGAGWIMKVKLSDSLDSFNLLDAEAYKSEIA